MVVAAVAEVVAEVPGEEVVVEEYEREVVEEVPLAFLPLNIPVSQQGILVEEVDVEVEVLSFHHEVEVAAYVVKKPECNYRTRLDT